MSSIQVELTEFSDLITHYTADFVGRGWLVEQVQVLLDEPGCRFVVLTGGPGVGKTAFLAHLAATHPRWPRYFIRRDSKDLLLPGDANTFLLTVGGQLATLYPHLFHPKNLEVVVRQRVGSVETGGEATGAYIEELHASPFYRVALLVEQEIRQVAGKATGIEIGRLVTEPRLMQMQDLQYLGLLDPARLLAQENPDSRIVVLVDALDELRYSPAEPDILRALCELPEMPPNLRFVISSRPEAFLARLLARGHAEELVLNVAGVDNRADLRTYTESVVGGDEWKPVLEQEGLNPGAFVDGLLGKAAGNFLYLKSVLGGIQQALEDPARRERLSHLLRVEELPADLGELYGYFLSFVVDWVKDSLGQYAWQKYLRPFLGVLAVAQEPLSEEQIIAFTDLKRETIRDLRRELRQFVETVDGQSPRYRIYHASFAEYLLNSEHNRDYWIDGQERHRRIADRYLNAWGGLGAGLPGLQDPAKRDLDGGYGLRQLAAHLEGAGRFQNLRSLVQDSSWYSARSKLDPSRRGYVSDLDRAFGVSVSQGNQVWPHLAANSLIRATLSGIAKYLPVEAYEALVRIGRGQEALQRVRMVSEAARKARALARIEVAARELGQDDLVEESRRELSGLPIQDGAPQTPGKDDWLPDLIVRFGARRTLQTLLRQQVIPDPDRSEAVERYLTVVSAASAIGQLEEARELLLECLDLLDGTWDHDRQDFLVRATRLSLNIGNIKDLTRIIESARKIELEHFRVYTLAEIALICSDAPDESLKKHSLAIAVEQLAGVNRTSTLQFELSKVALAMSKLGDGRASEFLEKAIQLAERPTQPAWHWEEKEVWVNVAEALALVGLCDEALGLIKRIGPGEMSKGRIVVELALQDRWEDAWQLAQDAHPIVRERALLNTARALAKKGELNDKRYQAIVTCIEENSKGKNANDQIAILGRLVDLALIVHDESRGRRYLQQIMNVLNEIEASKTADLIVNIAHYAVKLSEIDEICRLKSKAEALEEDPQYNSRSNAIGAIAIGLASLEREEDAWSLAQNIAESGKRLEVYVGICESERRQGRPVDEHFRGALAFARSIDNVGWVPTFWGKLAVLARHLGYQTEEGECVRRAIEGTHAIELSYAIGFNIHNSASVAKDLHELGLSVQAKDLLKFGLANFRQDFLGIDSLCRLVQSVKSIEAKSLWADVIQVVQAIEKPPEKAEALLEIVYAVGRSGDISQATEILPSVLAAIKEADQGRRLVLEFGAALSEFLEPEGEVFSHLIAEAFGYARSKDRPTALTWIAGLLPAFTKAGPTLPMETWTQIEQCERMLGQSTS